MGSPKVCKAYKTTTGKDAVTQSTNRLARVINWGTNRKVGEDLIKDYATIYSEYLTCTKTRSKVDCWQYAHDHTARTTLRAVSFEAIRRADTNKNCVKDVSEKISLLEKIPLIKTLGIFFDRMKLNLKKAKALYDRLMKKGR